MRDHLIVYINDRRLVIRGRDALLSLSDFLRMRLGLVGSKIVCSEGDCGACTVLVGRDFGGESLTYRPIDSCIQFMFQLDGAHVVSIEGIQSGGELTGVQQAMVDCHGSQCGFCTPGFVMAMTGLREEARTLDEMQLRTGLTGNLCRCTGYASILEAGLRSNAAPRTPMSELYEASPLLEEIRSLAASDIEIQCESFGERMLVASPATLGEALSLLAAHPSATIVAGATDVGVRINKSRRLPPVVLDLNRLKELDRVSVEGGVLTAGARASWTKLLAEFEARAPEFARVLALFGAPQIRHVGTIAGNIANASPIADSLPFLFVMDAVVVAASRAGRREININDFYHGYKKIDLRPGELIAEVRIPLPSEADLVRLYKVSRRRDLDIAGFTGAIRLQLDGDVIASARVAMGAVGPVVLRARKTEEFLTGRQFTEATMRAAGDIVVGEITPISDVRGSAEYRRTLARNVLLKFYHQVRADLAVA